ncbi:DUF418 domain-containing protein [Marinicellulosiphila megalodicopiae]|uniref:DUF418 domain-containing protein n=1 Tax=Marinicellulosiphila megalodicopiae TaxID=2724896 RepID=UPI003BAE6FFA
MTTSPIDAPCVEKRILSIDVVRGIALFGLLPMNILAFALPLSSYFTPADYQGELLSSYISHFFTSIIFDQKMMGMFSFLFGCSIVIMSKRENNKISRPWVRHYLRNFWLLIFGVIHAIFIWENDVLSVYALCAFFIYPLILLPRLYILFISIGLWLCVLGLSVYLGASISSVVENSNSHFYSFNSSSNQIAEYSAMFLTGYIDGITARFDFIEIITHVDTFILEIFTYSAFLRAPSLILLGVVFIKYDGWSKVISKSVLNKALVITGVCYLLSAIGFFINVFQNWNIEVYFKVSSIINQLITPVLVATYIIIIMYAVQNNYLQTVFKLLANAGRMAFTLYIMQSLLMTFVFYGWGLGLFGSLDRFQLWGVIICTWIIQLGFANLWLYYFKRGPLENVWRVLSFSFKTKKA